MALMGLDGLINVELNEKDFSIAHRLPTKRHANRKIKSYDRRTLHKQK